MIRTPLEEDFRAGLYWRVWLSVVAFAILLRLFLLLVFYPSHDSCLGLVYAVGTWVPLLIVGSKDNRKLMDYLQEHHRPTWERITHVPFFGPGGRNSFRGLAWLDSPEGMDDPILAAMKVDARRTMKLVLTVFCTYPILVPLLSI